MPYDIEKKRATQKRYRESIKAMVREAKNRPCMDCGKEYPYYVMDLDHRPEYPKLYEINKIHVRASNKTTIAAELAKCDAVCGNCHRVRTWSRANTSL